MKQLFLLTSLLLLLSTILNAQSANARRCGAYEAVVARDEVSPGYLQRVNQTFQTMRELAQEQASLRSANDTVYRIRTVFHVVYETAAENLDDSIILSQLEVLNEDYRRRNADTTLTRPEFLPVAADAGIEFFLATEDPDGNPTTGITRTLGDGGQFGFNPFTENMKSTAAGGKDPWPTDRYLNIWVCNVLNGFGILGYSYPPDGVPNWPTGSSADSAVQGVVLHYPVVGRNNPAPIDPTVNKGRSATHEVGHFLGLRHIWADDQGACEGDAQGDTDGMSDTPDQGEEHAQTCNYASNSCPDSPTDLPDQLENYMDYSDDNCLNMFTHEQVNLMRTVLQTLRSGIAEMVVVNSVNDVASNFHSVEVFPNPCNSVANFSVRLRNAGGYNYEVLNTLGEKIFAGERAHSDAGFHTLNLQALPAGSYVLRVSTNGESLSKRIVKL